MKTFKRSSLFVAALAAFVLFSSEAFAASADYFLKIEGVKGECKGKQFNLTENADGTFSASDIPGGTYNLIFTPKPEGGSAGKDHKGEIEIQSWSLFFEAIVSPRDVSSGQSSGKRTVGTGMGAGKSQSREAGSGLATGRRTYEPIQIRKRIDKSTPLLMKGVSVGEITVGDPDEDGDSRAKGQKTAGYDLKVAKKV